MHNDEARNFSLLVEIARATGYAQFDDAKTLLRMLPDQYQPLGQKVVDNQHGGDYEVKLLRSLAGLEQRQPPSSEKP